MEDPLAGKLLLQLLLILVNAFFTCTEIAVISLNDNKLKRTAESGDANAKTLQRLIEGPATFLATIQVGTTLAGFLGSAFAATHFTSRLSVALHAALPGIPMAVLSTLALVLITLALSFITMVLGELVPKRIAMQKPEPIAMAVARVIYGFSKLAAPIVWLLTTSTNGMLRLLRMSTLPEESEVTGEEIRMMVDIGEEKGTINPEEGEMIDNVLELSSKLAVELMTHRTDLAVLWIEDGMDVWEETLRSNPHSRYPVCGNDLDDVLGILHVRDFFFDLKPTGEPVTNEKLRPPYLVPETARADALLKDMKRNKTHLAVVVDEYGGTSGVVTMEDLLEEIVGEIEDEYDQEDPDIVRVGEGAWRVSGSIAIDKLEDELGVIIPQGEYDTLGGLIFAQMNTIPMDGSNPEVSVAGLHIVVEELADHRVEWAVITKDTSGNEQTPQGFDV